MKRDIWDVRGERGRQLRAYMAQVSAAVVYGLPMPRKPRQVTAEEARRIRASKRALLAKYYPKLRRGG